MHWLPVDVMTFVTGMVSGHHEQVETGLLVFSVWQVVPVATDMDEPLFVIVFGTVVTVRVEPLRVDVKVV